MLERFWSVGALEHFGVLERSWSIFGVVLERWSILERNERAKLMTLKDPTYLAGNTSMTDQVCNVQPVHRHAECFHYMLPIVDSRVESSPSWPRLIRVESESDLYLTRLEAMSVWDLKFALRT